MWHLCFSLWGCLCTYVLGMAYMAYMAYTMAYITTWHRTLSTLFAPVFLTLLLLVPALVCHAHTHIRSTEYIGAHADERTEILNILRQFFPLYRSLWVCTSTLYFVLPLVLLPIKVSFFSPHNTTKYIYLLHLPFMSIYQCTYTPSSVASPLR